jgi:peptidoglycan/xylan/chitin deacetylase (PgdA/CDA1 family)
MGLVSAFRRVLAAILLTAAYPFSVDFHSTRRVNGLPVSPNTSRPLLGDLPYGVELSSCSVPGTVALTFDDGPSEFTDDLIGILHQNKVKATFFIVGDNGNGPITNPDLGAAETIKRIHANGHQLGSHSYSHLDLADITSAQRKDEMIQNEQAFLDVLGFFPTYMRAPYLSCTDSCLADMKALGYHVVSCSNLFVSCGELFMDELDRREPRYQGLSIRLRTLPPDICPDTRVC